MDVRVEREAAGVSQEELARRVGISQTTLSRMESTGRDATPGEETLIRAALASNGSAVVDEVSMGQSFETATEFDGIPHLAPYPSAPDDVEARRAWVKRRNTAMQSVRIPEPASGTFGRLKKAAK